MVNQMYLTWFRPPISINKLHLKTLADRGLAFVSILYLSFLQSEAEYQDLSKRGDWSPWTHAAEKHVFLFNNVVKTATGKSYCRINLFWFD